MSSVLKPEFEYLLRTAMDEPRESVDVLRLEAILVDDPEAMAVYVELMTVHALLQWRSGRKLNATRQSTAALPPVAAPLPAEEPTYEFPDPQFPASRPASPVLGFLGGVAQQSWVFLSDHAIFFSALAATILVAALVTFGARNLGRPNPAAKSEITDIQPEVPDLKSQISVPKIAANPQLPSSLSRLPTLVHIQALPQSKDFDPRQVAVLTGVYNTRWSGPVQNLGLGTPLMIGQELRLDNGLAEITFKLGARVIVAAPAHMRLTSIDGIEVLNGKVTVRADTEDARGFVVKSAVARMVDLGTEFGAAIEQDRQTDLHVFQGVVEISRTRDQDTRAIRLTAGQRIVMRQSGNIEVPSVGADSGRFIRSLASAEKILAAGGTGADRYATTQTLWPTTISSLSRRTIGSWET